MSSVTQVFDWKIATGYDVTIVTFAVALEDLAARFAIELDTWDEDGWGPARGAFVRLSSGRIIFLRELRHIKEHFGLIRTEILAENQDIVTFGLDFLVDEARVAFDLSPDIIEWRAGDESFRLSEKIIAAIRARKDGC